MRTELRPRGFGTYYTPVRRTHLLQMMVLPLFVGSSAGCSDQGFDSLTLEDTFVQPDIDITTDVLFVVDNSASMAEEQDRLATNFTPFVDALSSSYANWQVGVVTTDVDAEDAGVLRGGVFSATTPDLAAGFRAAVVAGTAGSRDEQGLKAAVMATNGDRNPGFLRDGAGLNVVIISDEDDHSPDPVSDYLERLADLAPDVSLHALVGDLPAGCASGTSAADAGARYLEAAAATDGFVESICVDDYTGLLTRIGLDVAGWTDTFPLSQLPSEVSLEVHVDDVAIPNRPLDGWQYAVGDNAIVFSGRAVPRPGMGIVVTYTRWTGPT